MNQDKKVVKISEVIENQIPEFILTENPNLAEFLKQYYISQEYQGATVDIVENIIDYKNVDSFDSKNLIESTTLSQEVSYFDDAIYVNSTNGWPSQYGLLKIDNEIITYTGITTNTFTGCIRGFSGIESLSDPDNPEYLKFSSTETEEHLINSSVENLSNLFLLEFFKKTKYQFSPGFEELDFDSRINAPNFISKVKSFYQTKGTDEAFKILFKVLYGEDVKVIKPRDLLFTTSDDQWIVAERFICEVISGDPLQLNGQTLYQDENGDILPANGSIYKVSSVTLNGNQYYNVDIFSGYSNNLNPKGSIFGEFNITPKTYCTSEVSANSNTISAVSTIGFKQSGTLNVGDLVVSYSDKTNTEFLDCVGITTSIVSSTPIYASNFVYSYENGNIDNVVSLRLLNTLSSIDNTNTILAYENDLLKVDNLGSTKESIFTDSLHYNVPAIIHAGEVYDEIPEGKYGISKNSGKVKTKYPHYLKNGDVLEVFSATTNRKVYDCVVSNSNSETSNQFTISGSQNLTLNHIIKFKRQVIKSSSNQYSEINNKFSINIQDSYEDSENYYVTSNGFFSGNINPYKREFEFELETPTSGVSSSIYGQHTFYDGELITVSNYTTKNIAGTPGFKNAIGITTGLSLYVKKIDSNEIKLAFTKNDIINGNYINFAEKVDENNSTTSGYVDTLKLILSKLYGNTFTSTKLFKKIPKSVTFPKEKIPTRVGSIGILANGVEIQNYKSFDRLYNGEITSIDVLDPGNGYDLLNPPEFKINSDTNFTSIITPELSGDIESIAVIDSGFDYIETPIVTVKGGGNDSVRTEVKMKKVQRELSFNADDSDVVVTLDPINKFILDYPHKLFPGDGVIYETFGNTPIGIGTGTEFLSNNSIYYIFDVGAGTSFRLANTKEDAFAGIGTINLRTRGKGLQKFTSVKLVNVVDSVNIIDIETQFKYKKLPLKKANINHYDEIFEFENHGFVSGDEISYSYTGNSILNTSQYYYVIKIDDDKFKLSSTKDLNTPIIINASNSTSIHYFSYSPIRTEITGRLSTLGISTIGSSAELYPKVKGSISKVNIINSEQYGSNIFNYEYAPKIDLVKGKSASFKPIISNGKIVRVIIFNPGYGYYNTVNIEVIGSGVGAKLHPVIVDGQITEIKVISSGIGYDQYTKLLAKNEGSGAEFKANIKYWTLNEVSKYSSTILNRGLLVGENYYQNKNNIGIYYLTPTLSGNFNITSNSHSPIIGWSYDGCPIYGPYAYENVDGSGDIIKMTSSYRKIRKSPIISESSNLDCIEDYTFVKDLGTLDENNGRYCITPEYPNGVYAYFATSTFPYFIGPEYNYSLVEDNLDLNYSQDLDFNTLDIVKHTFPYYIQDKENYYDYFDFYPNIYKEDLTVLSTLSGTVDDIEVVSSGNGYSIGDKIIFNNEGTGGFGASAEVSELMGVGITSISSQTLSESQVTFVQTNNVVTGIASTTLNIKDNYYINITGISSSAYSSLEGTKKIAFKQFKSKLTKELPANSGILTSITITDSITNFDIDSKIKIGTEILNVVGFDYLNNSITVLRENDSNSAASQSEVELLSNKFQFNLNQKLDLSVKNEVYYFDSDLISVGIGTTPGSGNTITKTPYGQGKSETRFIRTAGIWMPNHKFKNGEKVTYFMDPNGFSMQTNLNSGTYIDEIPNLYIVDLGNDIIGFTNDKTKISSADGLLYFNDSGAGHLHKLVTDRSVVTGNILYNESIVSTASSHGLSLSDVIRLNVITGSTVVFSINYNSATAKLRVDSSNNPKLTVYKNQIVEFDISSITLSDTRFKLYTDENFENEYIGNGTSGVEVTKTSTKLTLRITEHTPNKLYYNIETSKDLYQDTSVQNANCIEILPSIFNSDSEIIETTENTFTINLTSEPEVSNYVAIGNTSLSYNILNSQTTGPINDTRLLFKGSDYKKLPSISSINSSGINATLIPITTTIGKINKIETISNSIYPSDTTLKPISNLYSILHLDNNYKVSKLNLNFGGANYLSSPSVKLYNENTNEIYDSFSAYCNLSGPSVDEIVIANPGYGLPKTGNKIIFTENSNGVKIIEASSLETSPGTFLVSLRVETPSSGFTTSNPLPFNINDKIFVEGIVSSGFGYNSEKYSYNTFNVVGIITSYSSPDQSIIRYELPNDPGIPISYNFAYVINSNDLPDCEVIVSENEFYSNEPLENTTLINNSVDTLNKSILKVYDSSEFIESQIIRGKNSNSEGTIVKINPQYSEFSISNSKTKPIGWIDQKGNLSEIVQKLPDNDYYQNFSYSLKSNKQNIHWDSPVSDLVHVTGLKKFGDLIVESEDLTGHQVTSNDNSNINISINSYVNANTINDFDLVLEDVDDNNNLYSEILTFKSTKLTDYSLSIKNRVLSIDDISSNFNNDSSLVTIVIDTLPIFGSGTFIAKYFTFIESTKSIYTDFELPSLSEIYLSKRNDGINLVSYSYFEDESLGTFISQVNPNNSNEILLEFVPSNIFNIISSRSVKDIVALNTDQTIVNYGNLSNVAITTSFSSEVTPTEKRINIGTLANCKSGTVYVGISTTYGSIEEYLEFTFLYNGQQIISSIYAENEIRNLGEVGISTGITNNIEITYTPISNIGSYLYINANLLVNSQTNPSYQDLEYAKLNSSRLQFTASTLDPVGISSITKDYAASKYVIEVQKTVGITTQRSIIQINSVHYDIIPEQEKYLNNINYGIIGNFDDLEFNTIFDQNSGTYTLTYYPNDLATYDIKFYQKSILRSTNPLL